MSGVVRLDLCDALLACLTACTDGVRFTTDNNAAATEAGFV